MTKISHSKYSQILLVSQKARETLQQIFEGLIFWRGKIQFLHWPPVDLQLHRMDIFIGKTVEVSAFRDVLPDELVRVLYAPFCQDE